MKYQKEDRLERRIMIKFDNFYKKYKNEVVIEKSSFVINKDKVSFFLGPNGAGKTTLIKCLGGLEEYQGEIHFTSKEDTKTVKPEMLIIWDDCPFYNDFTGIKNLLVMCENHELNANKIYDLAGTLLSREVLDRKVKTYSYGQRKKLALVLQKILNPDILVMDEISNGLDYDSMKQLRKETREIAKNSTVILTGHQFSFYEGIVDEVFVIHDKKVKQVTREYINEGYSFEKLYERYYENENVN